jgi:glycosyltransferase involved in cell wall biosynthesis
MNPLVSAVIPTHHRPELVLRAVRSALRQTYTNLEVIVVVDGPEPETVKMLESLQEPRLRVIELMQNVHSSEARNIGVRNAFGEWVSFLDDDDEWSPTKIEKQIALLTLSDPCTNFVACQCEVRGIGYTDVLPHHFPTGHEHWSEYIYCRSEHLPIHTYLIRTEIMLALPFAKGLYSNQENDWLLRAYAANALTPQWHNEVLASYNCDGDRVRITTSINWESSYEWARLSGKSLMTRKAYSYFLLKCCIRYTKQSKYSFRNNMHLLYDAVYNGKIDFRFCVYFAAYAVFGDKAISKLKLLRSHIKRGRTAASQRRAK